MEKVEKKLSTEEWLVYNYLKERTQAGLWTTQKDLQVFLESMGYPRILRIIRKYVYDIRHCSRIQKVIISGANGYKIMTDPDKQAMFLYKKIRQAANVIIQNKQALDMIKKDGQLKFSFDTKEREIIESILK